VAAAKDKKEHAVLISIVELKNYSLRLPIPWGLVHAGMDNACVCVWIFQPAPATATATHGAPPLPCSAGVHTGARHRGSDRCAKALFSFPKNFAKFFRFPITSNF